MVDIKKETNDRERQNEQPAPSCWKIMFYKPTTLPADVSLRGEIAAWINILAGLHFLRTNNQKLLDTEAEAVFQTDCAGSTRLKTKGDKVQKYLYSLFQLKAEA